ncbi:xanthine dehydrogenase family protein molybdopterin-binding subunit [Paraburkholderia phenoliruptrix]|uniref:xanthine dehydrogenase family protein molybdopterin-binding subunit n=1 Tax=Paraburkholderia phenoliruptrix TaxID=252970 RepID=UPI001C4E647A|nr:xanthine dehydrogenase family protein molybdopterin-binding subunit [Paraburkholderia phenoliruptrix]MBW0448131.1 xanthine dehydrogenase family protein molybdopterin-binding subunit [Paraburkholderia phenoliruptrix]MBW9100238.1 xanthine dehydrogenase family protein molybdopterin-binding subunit [Paraburkholderia phenoliruptrix]MBW9104702.1 xanthine dehydrogenase family protein molybdopterin-binding subunit [Paraburkholderia phenoliruptrix]MBW9130530.1 xanthine dehydrogenase family protein mo
MSQGLLDAHRDAKRPQAESHEPRGLSRRTFLKLGVSVGAMAGGGLLLGFSVPAVSQDQKAGKSVIGGDGNEAPQNGVFAPNAFIQIDTAGKVTLIIPKVEMGQGVYTSIPMLIAEELEVPLDTVTLDHAPPDEKLFMDPLLGGQLTGGSTSIRYAWEPMRRAGATARTLLINAAAQQWQVDAASCHAQAGQVIHAASNRSIGYGQLVEAAAKLPAPQNVPLKNPKDFKIVGTAVKRLDSPEKVDGTARFGLDVRVPDMVYAAIANCPVFGGTLASVDDTHAKKIPGVRQVVKIDNAVAVIGDHTWAAKRGLQALDIKWNEGENGSVSMKQIVDDLAHASQRDGAVARKEGDVAQAFSNAKKRVDVIYQQPFLAHATMEPINCTVHVRPDSCEIWLGSQVPTRVRDAAMAVTGLPADKIIVHNHLIGGGFGRRLEFDMVTQAVKIARQVSAPVKVLWTREEDIQHDMYRPYYYDKISAGLDANGKPLAWQHRIVGSSILARFAPPAFKNGVDPDAVEVAADLPYDLPNQLVDYVRQEPRAIPTAFWRGVGPTRSTFVVESFIDELAAEAKVDPVKYRRDLLGKTPRALNVLNTAAQAANWGSTLPTGQGRGVSVMHAFGSYFAIVVEVAVEQGEVAVKRVVCAVDCGMVVNPNTVEAQVQGGIIFGITGALYSEITIKDGRVQQNNFTDYRMLRIDQTPPIDVHIVKSSEAPGGIGEPGTAALAPALTNAIFAATGKRLRQLPVGSQLQTA